jgi:flavin reductase (DIM6/NTAB) family NADH-FMN oxidoreductase RutF
MKQINSEDIVLFEKQYRTNLINGLSGFKSALLVGTTNKLHQHNLAIFSNVVHIGANPPLMGLIHRPVSVEKHTYENIKETGYFTLNHVLQSMYKQAHQTSARYERSMSEFEACGFTPVIKGNCLAPYVQESSLQIGLTLEDEIKIRANDTILLVGRVKELFIANELLDEAGFINLDLAKTALVHGLETYYTANKLERLAYAKANP